MLFRSLLDPGSLVYDKPDKFGYRLLCRGLVRTRAHIAAASSWGEMLNYETVWMTREELVRATYDAALKMIEIKVKYGLLNEESASLLKRAIESAYLVGASTSKAPSERKLAHLEELYPSVGYLFRKAKPKLLLTFLKERMFPHR